MRMHELQLTEDFFRNRQVKKLRSIAGGDTYTIIYLKLLILSIPTRGRLYCDSGGKISVQIANDIDESVENVKTTLRLLESRRLLVWNTDTELEITLPGTERVGG